MVDLSSIKPGLNTDVVVNVDFSKEIIDVRKAFIYDVLEKRIILSQTNPPMASYHVGKKIAVTCLVKKDDKPVRYGFYGKITELVRDYELVSSDTVPALVIELDTGPVEFNVRMHFRVEPRGDSGIVLSVKGEKMNMIDISIGGARVTHYRDCFIEQDQKIKGILNLDGRNFNIEARVLRVWQTYGSQKITDLECVAMQFLNVDKELEDVLGRKIRKIEREMRFREMFP